MGSCPLLEKYGREIVAGTLNGCHPVAVGLFIRDIAAVLGEEMNSAAKLAVPLTAEVEKGFTWYDAKG